MTNKEEGLYLKYTVERCYNNTGKHTHCNYFVLDWACDKFTIPAMEAYVKACEEEYPKLAKDLKKLISVYR